MENFFGIYLTDFGKYCRRVFNGAALDAAAEASFLVDLYASFTASNRHVVYFMSVTDSNRLLSTVTYADGDTHLHSSILPLVNTGNPETGRGLVSHVKGATCAVDASLGTVNGQMSIFGHSLSMPDIVSPLIAPADLQPPSTLILTM